MFSCNHNLKNLVDFDTAAISLTRIITTRHRRDSKYEDEHEKEV